MKVSIIIPVYNKSKYLRKLLQQIKDQSFFDYECLLIDDGSFDGSEKICDYFVEKDARFKAFHIVNGGVSHARNVGLDHARGEYITFIDADDEVHRDFLMNMVLASQKSAAPFVIGNLMKIWASGRDSEVLPIPYQGYYTINTLLRDFAKVQRDTGIYGYCAAKLIRRDVIGNLRFDDKIRLAEDLDFYLEIYPRIDSVFFDTHAYYYYLQAAENSSMLDRDSSIDYYSQLKIQLKIMAFLVNKGSFCNENKKIMVKRVYDYVFFTLFHSSLKKIKRVSVDMKELSLPIYNKAFGEFWTKRIMLFFFSKDLHLANYLFLLSYRTGRKIVSTFRRGKYKCP